MALAAQETGTLLFIRPESYTKAFEPYSANLVPCLTRDNYRVFAKLILRSRMVELAYEPGIEHILAELRSERPGLSWRWECRWM